MNFIEKIGLIWQKINIVQRFFLFAVVLTFAVVTTLLIHWARKPDMRMLYQGLSPDEASKITEKISDMGIAYSLRNGGTCIYVPEKKVYHLYALGQLFFQRPLEVDILNKWAYTDFLFIKYPVTTLLIGKYSFSRHIQPKLINIFLRSVNTCPAVS